MHGRIFLWKTARPSQSEVQLACEGSDLLNGMDMAGNVTKSENSAGKIWCIVAQPDSISISLKLREDAKGQDLLDAVCEHLGIVESDYFGLQFTNNRGEIFWLNLRNRISRQLAKTDPCSFFFSVKFYVQPYQLIQSSTRRQFFLNGKRDLEAGKLKPNGEQSVRMQALIAQVTDGEFRENHIGYNPSVTSEWPNDFRSEVVMEHCRLRGMPKESAEFRFLEEISKLEDYGTEYHHARTEDNKHPVIIGVGIEALKIAKQQENSVESLPYSCLHMATHKNKCVELDIYINEQRETETVMYRLHSKEAATALYRSITEHHAFFRCDSIGTAVKEQVSNDFFDTFRSLFYDESAEQNYIFDTKRTCREAYDHARRVLFNFGSSIAKTMDKNAKDESAVENDNDGSSNAVELQEKLDSLMESCLCQACRDKPINTAFQCGHMFGCTECVKQLTHCPLCRTEIMTIIPVYLPVEFDLNW